VRIFEGKAFPISIRVWNEIREVAWRRVAQSGGVPEECRLVIPARKKVPNESEANRFSNARITAMGFECSTPTAVFLPQLL